MLRAALVTALCMGALACGTPCSRIAAAESAANDKSTACGSGSGSWDSARIQRCESGLTKCSADDQKWMDTYADCLQKLPTCSEGQSLSWGISRVACAESIVKVSLSCANAIR